MKTMITKLWNGDFSPIENCGKNDPQTQELIRLMELSRDKLYRSLSEAQQPLLENYTINTSEYISLLSEQAFCEGFSLCARLLTEAFSTTE